MTLLKIRIFGDGQHMGLYFWWLPTHGRLVAALHTIVLGLAERRPIPPNALPPA